jgi:hypothetical protein
VITRATAKKNGSTAILTTGTSIASVVNIEFLAHASELIFRVQRHWT